MNIKTFIFYSVIFKIIPRNLKFKLIHRFNLWGSNESVSGPGSEISSAKAVIAFLRNFIQSEKIVSILDVPCGDFNWMQHLNLSGIQYTGGDIVEAIIKKNQDAHGSSNVRFGTIDIVKDSLPDSDLLIVRDLFIHFSTENTLLAIENIKHSAIKYILVTTFPDTQQNISIKDGYNYNINLQLHPFNFPIPFYLVEEQALNNGERKCIGLWEVKEL